MSAPSAPSSWEPTSLATWACPLGKVEPMSVVLKTSDKLELNAHYYPPYKPDGRVPGVILVHDQGGKASELEETADYLAGKGLGVLLLSLRGHEGNVDERFDWKKANEAKDEKQLMALWAFASKDIEAGAEFLGSRKELHSSKLILVAHGKSCSLAVQHAIKDRNTMCTALIEPVQKVFSFELKKELAELDGLPTLLMCGKGGKKEMFQVREAATPKNVKESTFEVSCLTTKPEDVLSDKRLPKTLYNWLKQNL